MTVVMLASIQAHVAVVLEINITPTAMVIGLHRWDMVLNIARKTGEAGDRTHVTDDVCMMTPGQACQISGFRPEIIGFFIASPALRL